MRSIAFQTFQNFITPTLLQTSSLLDSTITAQTKTRKLHRADGENLEQNNIAPKGIDGRLIVIKNGKKDCSKVSTSRSFLASYIETADAFGGFGGLTDQMMDNEEPEKRLVLIHNGKKMLKRRDKDPKRSLGEEEDETRRTDDPARTDWADSERGGRTGKEGDGRAGGSDRSRRGEDAGRGSGCIGVGCVNQKKRKIEPERTRSSVSLRPASKKAKKKGDHDDDADANRMKMAMGGHENRKLTRKGQPDDKKKEEEEERLAREETERLAKLEADRLAKEEAERLAKEEEERLRKEAVESERKRR
ncbi:hypothetical protein BLNAU_19719 [Blattamonas nauphoetae]|uniref:Uncharacterized protein n=1 Tax=Blattamonas nauphoetae TaxID=2049346 RepID=A0ABQ9X0V9_9EUKA|nr:hypothetical protein BLNAU_19719 [Blattamonas nauphoetae]